MISDGIISFSRRGFAAGNGEGAVIPILAEGAVRPLWRALWLITGAAAVLAAAQWLRTPSVPYLAGCTIATGITLGAALRFGAQRRWAAGFIAAMTAFVISAAIAQRSVARIDREWDAYRAEIEFGAAARLERALLDAAAELSQEARRALDAPSEHKAAFDALAMLVKKGTGERGIVVFRAGRPQAWAGTTRVVADGLTDRLGAVFSPFYLTLYATAERGSVRAVATALVHADPPTDRLAEPLDAIIARQAGVRGYEYQTAADAPPGFTTFASRTDTLFGARPAPITPSEARLRAVEQATRRGAVLLAVAVAFLLVGSWSRPSSLLQRLFAAGAAVMVISLAPLNPTFSSVTRLFDPVVYLAPLGGPLTASVGALMLTSSLVLLGLLAVLRSSARVRSRWLALAAVLGIAALGPFLLRDLARGISPPPWGVTPGLWLAWEVALFLAGVAILLAGVSAGQALLGRARGLPPFVAPVFAAAAALIAPLLWEAPGSWPDWYPALWILAIGSLALARRARGFVLTAAVVAACGAATLVWGTVAKKRVELAERDVAGLSTPDVAAQDLLTRMARDLEQGTPPTSRAELLQRYVRSDLDDAGYPAELTSWSWTEDGGLRPDASLELSEFQPALPEVASVVAEARRTGAAVMRAGRGASGVHLILAIPHDYDRVTTVAVAPRTRLIPDDPFSALIGLAPPAAAEPPYSLTLAPNANDPRAPRATRWQRIADELHGDWVILASGGPTRVHVEVELRSSAALIQRGVLVVLLDVVLITLIWTLNAAADGGLVRWASARVGRWAESYRARLTFSLFGFFVVPAVVFAIWSYQRLRSDDRQSRELLVRETLRAFTTSRRFDSLDEEEERLGAPLFLYADGELRATSDSLYDEIAPLGRFLPPDIALSVSLGDEVTQNARQEVGGVPTLVGYRAAPIGVGSPRIVAAAPARSDELALDRQRRDLGILVLFATAAGALAALWLSGNTARTFARPIGTLQRAALAIAAGEREPDLAEQPLHEFRPVFSAFRRMAADLSASRTALEEAQRQTAAVLRNVASGVVAVGPDLRVTLANPQADALLRAPLPPATPLESVAGPEISDRVREFLTNERGSDEEEFDLELHGRQIHGRLTRLSRNAGSVLTLDDVTELARAQRVLAWGEMARQVAHEIKNPLTPIRLGVQHLKRAHGDGRVDYERVLDQNVGRILAEIDRLDEIARAFSRYGTAPAERPPGSVIDVAAIVRDVVELERMGEGEVVWRVNGADQPALAIASNDELREVLLNVLENARLANARHVDVGVSSRGERVEIGVADDGVGIPDDVLPKIFEPHFSTRTSGSGLGLAISRSLVDAWGGEITVSSTRGEGTRVVIALAAAPRP
jgi:two-component system nitrogen regulation sensor histidine kinase NtrY